MDALGVEQTIVHAMEAIVVRNIDRCQHGPANECFWADQIVPVQHLSTVDRRKYPSAESSAPRFRTSFWSRLVH